MIKNKLWIVSASVISAFTLSQAAYSQTIEEAVSQTIQTNPTVLAQSNRRLSVDQTIDQARAGYYPTVDLGVGYGWEESDNPTTRANGKPYNDHNHQDMARGEANIAIRQMIYDGFATKSAVDQSESLAESAGYSVADTAENTSLRAVQVYLDVLRRQGLLKVTEENLDSHANIYDQISQRAESGVGTTVDADQTQGRLALSKANLEANIGNLHDAKSSYHRVVGAEADSLSVPSQECCDKAPASLDDALKVAHQHHPALRAAIANHEAALALEKGAKAPFHPRVDLEIDTTANNNLDGRRGDNNDLLAMFRLRWNLVNGGADSARIDETKFLSEVSDAEIELAKREIESDVRLAWNALESTTARLTYLQQHVEASEATRDAYQQQFNVGLRTLLDLLDTENEVLTARVDYVNAYYDRLYACYWLSETTGKLLEALELEAPAEAITVAAGE
jgi:adhesin transport system outer membrane protein